MVKRIGLFLGLMMALSFSSQSLSVTELKVSVDRNPVMVNESFVLEIIADDSFAGDELDLSPLGKTNLVVGRTATSSQTQIINGNISRTTTWSVVLLSRKAGKFTIPAFEIEGVKSRPVVVEVIKPAPGANTSSPDIMIKNERNTGKIYLQQTIQLTTKLYLSPDINLQSGTLSDPELSQAQIQQIGKDKNTSEIINGQRYRVIERNYLVTPQASGQFTIISPTFNGEISTGRRSAYSAFASTKAVSTIGEDIAIFVEPIPSGYQGSWLPSDMVQLHDEISPAQSSFEVGEPITRTFTLTALNVNKEQLPTISGEYPASFKVYPDKSETFSNVRNQGVVAQRINSEAIVATQAGTFTLPEVSLSWFNTITHQIESATVPARTITITPNSTGLSDDQVVTNLMPSSSSEQVEACPEAQPAPICEETTIESTSSFWKVVAIVGWTAFLFSVIFRLIQRRARVKSQSISKRATNEFSLAELKQACQDKKLADIRLQVLFWGQHQFNVSYMTLDMLQKKVTPSLAESISTLNAALYNTEHVDLDCMAIYKAIKEFKSQKTTLDASLPPLN
jgi:hypothetical protein